MFKIIIYVIFLQFLADKVLLKFSNISTNIWESINKYICILVSCNLLFMKIVTIFNDIVFKALSELQEKNIHRCYR